MYGTCLFFSGCFHYFLVVTGFEQFEPGLVVFVVVEFFWGLLYFGDFCWLVFIILLGVFWASQICSLMSFVIFLYQLLCLQIFILFCSLSGIPVIQIRNCIIALEYSFMFLFSLCCSLGNSYWPISKLIDSFLSCVKFTGDPSEKSFTSDLCEVFFVSSISIWLFLTLSISPGILHMFMYFVRLFH